MEIGNDLRYEWDKAVRLSRERTEMMNTEQALETLTRGMGVRNYFRHLPPLGKHTNQGKCVLRGGFQNAVFA